MFEKTYFAIVLVFFVVQTIASYDMIRETIYSHIDYARTESGFSYKWEEWTYVTLTSLGSISSFLLNFALKSIGWWYFIPDIYRIVKESV